VNKENASKLWTLIQEAGLYLLGQLPDHPNHPKGRNPYAHIALCVKEKFGNSRYTNTITGISINFYNFFVFMFAVSYHWETEILTAILIFNALMYSSIYFVLNKTKKWESNV